MSLRNFEYILRDPAVERWLRFKAEVTKGNYVRTLNRFLGFIGPELSVKDPSGFVKWAKSRPDNLEVQDIVEKFGEHENPTSRLISMSVVRSLLKRNGTNLPSTSGQRQVKKAFHRSYTRQEVQTLLSYLDRPLWKLYVLICKDSGLRAQDVLSLCYRHVKKDLEKPGNEYVHLALEPGYYSRRKASGITFVGPDTVKLLKQLIDEGVIKKEGAIREVTVKGRGRQQRKLKKDPTQLFPMTYSNIGEVLRIARKKANLDPLLQPSHGLRKFFTNSLNRTGMDERKKKQLEGHSLGVENAYTDQLVEELRTCYEQAYQFLDLSEEAGAGTRVKELEKTLDSWKLDKEAMRQEIAEVKTMILDLMRQQKKP